MTDKERLAIAEEIIGELVKRKAAFRLADVNAYLTEGGTWLAFENMDNPSGLVRGAAGNPIDAVFLARQKLAAEREASRTPEERRLREVLTKIRDGLPSITCRQIGELVEQALEQGA